MAADSSVRRKVPSNIALERHMIFVCPECGQTMDTLHNWRQHLNTVHDYARKKAKDFDFKVIDNKYHECQICLKRLAHGHHVPVILQYHRFTHLTYGGPFRCRYCAGSYGKKRLLSIHLFRCHSQLMNKLDNEYKMEKIRQALALRHPQFNREFFMRFICPQCGKLFQRFAEWQEHIDKGHNNTSKNLCMHRIICTRDYYCDQCSETLKAGPTWDQLRRHHFSHLPYPSYFQCAFCFMQKSFKTDLFLHFIKSHRMEYLKNKKYILAPEEWAAQPKEEIMKQILMYTKCDMEEVINPCESVERSKAVVIPQKQKTDPKELDNSKSKWLYPNKGEASEVSKATKVQRKEEVNTNDKRKANTATVKDILQKALHDSCIVFEDELATAGSHTSNNSKSIELDDNELEEICLQMFEEIPDCIPHRQNGSATHLKPFNTLLATKNLKMEMQKYINYLCPECLREFDDEIRWRSHVFEEHNLTNTLKSKFRPLNNPTTAYLCLTCYQVQRTSKHVDLDLQLHYFQHMSHQGYLKCMLCLKTKSSKPKMLQHLEYVHRIQAVKSSSHGYANRKPKDLLCLECDKTYDESIKLQNHLRVCTGRLEPLAVGLYDNVAKNMMLLEHLHKASQSIDKMLLDHNCR